MKPRIAIIGAGLAGLTLAHELNAHADITLFEKARGLGGRMSTRRNDPHQWDHGAQFFTARSRAFKERLAPFIEEGVVAEWQPNIITLSPDKKPFKRPWFEAHYVGVPGMNMLIKALGDPFNIELSTEVSRVVRHGEQWQLFDKQAELLGEYDWVVSSAPLPQTQTLLPEDILDDSLSQYKMQPCYALLLSIDDAGLPHWDAATVNDAAIRWINFNHRLPGRHRQAGAVVVHSTPEWATSHLEDDQEQVKQQLLNEFCELTAVKPEAITSAQLHRWRYALSGEVVEPEQAFIINNKQRLAACGDWCLGGRVEAAFESAQQLGLAIRQQLA